MATPTNHVISGWIYIARSPWHFGDFRNIFLPSVDEDQTKISSSERGAPGTVTYNGKSGLSYCIAFIKRLDEGLR